MRRILVNVEGLTISTLLASGRHTPVLLIHGNSSCNEIFRHQVDQLRGMDHVVVAPDLPGHGRSADAREPLKTYSFPGYARVLRQLMEQLGFAEYHIIGWSLGGHVGLELWYGSSRVRSLLITGTPPVTLSALGAQRGFRQSPIMELAGTRVFERADVDAYGSAMLGHRLDHRQRIARAIFRTDGRARYWMVRNGLRGLGVDEVMAVRECKRPLAIVLGARDPFVNADYVRSLLYCNLWKNKPIVVDAGHAPHWQQPELFNRYMRGFLSHVDRPS
jgi:pimeloyl-ACP methyl ester carboxylesterase